jgi:hypothetical protein
VAAIATFDVSAHVIAADHHFSRKTSRDTAKALGARAALLAWRDAASAGSGCV